MKRIISLMLTLAVALSLLILPAGAASTPEEALGEVNIYSGGYSMNYLAVNGRVQTQSYTYFLYRNSVGETQEIPAYCVTPDQYGVPQTRPPRGGRHFRRMMMLRDHEISIHALREEGDTSRLTFFLQASKFLSTPSARRATALHPPESASNGISIHALREEGDGPVGAIVGASTAFLSTPSARRATQGMYKADLLLFVFLSTPSARRATYG